MGHQDASENLRFGIEASSIFDKGLVEGGGRVPVAKKIRKKNGGSKP